MEKSFQILESKNPNKNTKLFIHICRKDFIDEISNIKWLSHLSLKNTTTENQNFAHLDDGIIFKYYSEGSFFLNLCLFFIYAKNLPVSLLIRKI